MEEADDGAAGGRGAAAARPCRREARCLPGAHGAEAPSAPRASAAGRWWQRLASALETKVFYSVGNSLELWCLLSVTSFEMLMEEASGATRSVIAFIFPMPLLS